MNDCCGLPFIKPEKSGEIKSLKDIVEEIKDGTTEEYKELSNIYNVVMKDEKKDEEVS